MTIRQGWVAVHHESKKPETEKKRPPTWTIGYVAQIIPEIDEQTHKWREYVGQIPPNHMAHIAGVR